MQSRSLVPLVCTRSPYVMPSAAEMVADVGHSGRLPWLLELPLSPELVEAFVEQPGG